MREIIFAKTRHVYDSYNDFWCLVELSGFPIIYVDDMDLYNSNHLYITAPYNGDYREHMIAVCDVRRKAELILWQLERPGDGLVEDYARDNHELVDNHLFDRIIVSDRQLAKDAGFQFVPLGSHEKLGKPGYVKDYDFIHLMCYSLRRSFLFDYLTPLNMYRGYSIAQNGWGDVRNDMLQRSRYMLNVHQDGHPYIEPLRFTLAAAYGLPIITEISVNQYPYSLWDSVVQVDRAGLIRMDFMKHIDYVTFQRNAQIARRELTTSYSFRNCLEAYL